VRSLDRAIKYMVRHSGVWPATGLQMAQHYIDHCLTGVEAQLAAEAPGRVPHALRGR
jgi:hypothetical protein